MVLLEKEGFTIALYCTTYYYGGYESIIANALNATGADYKIAFFHGGTERVHVPDSWKAAGCRYMIDAGVDLGHRSSSARIAAG